ncbi:hypothetical protein LCGC14_0634200 [marine sediment metagenome]
MATINHLVRGSNNPSTIYLRFKHGTAHDYTKSTGYLIDPKNWNNDKKQPYKRTADLKNLATDLAELSNALIKIFNNTPKDDITSDWLRHQIGVFKGDIKPEKTKSDILVDSIQNIIDTANIRENGHGGLGLSKSRINSYKNLLKIIREYQGSKVFRVKEVNIRFGKEFLNWMLNDMQYSESYARKKLDDLKTVCSDAEIYGVEVSPQLRKIKGGKSKNENIIYFTSDELDKIENANLVGEAHINARRWLLLGCNLGQRGGDLLGLSENNIVTRKGLDVIELTQQKTSSKVTIPILEKTREILEDGFPRPIAIQNFNIYIKDICRISEINQPTRGRKYDLIKKRRVQGTFPKWEIVSSHVMRRTFATLLYGDLPTPLIMKITGHSTERMFAQYLGKDSLDYAQQIADYYELQKIKLKKQPQLQIVKEASND